MSDVAASFRGAPTPAPSQASELPLYIDPTSSAWPQPNLISDLIATPTLDHLAPLERQSTVVLAWLLHHSPVLARSLLAQFFAGDDEATSALDDHLERIGSRTWCTLRPIEGVSKGHMYPDLSIAGSNRAFELLVEIKIGASIHSYELPDGSVLHQPDAYIRSWTENYDSRREAAVRRVGTLTLGGVGVELDRHPFRAANITWSGVDELLAELLEEAGLETEVMAVALDARAAIQERILGLSIGPLPDDPVLAWGYSFLSRLMPRVVAMLPEGQLKQRPRVVKDYVTAFTTHTSGDESVRVWFGVTPRGARYNEPGREATFWVGESEAPLPDHTRESLLALGFTQVKDAAGYKSLRLGFPVAVIQAVGHESAQVDRVLATLGQLIEALRAS